MSSIAPVSKVFVTVLPDQTKKAVFITSSGETKTFTYRQTPHDQDDKESVRVGDQKVSFDRKAFVELSKELLLDRGSLSELLQEATVVPSEKFDDTVEKESNTVRELYKKYSKSKVAKKLRREREREVECQSQYGARVFHLISGVVITPVEMAIGFVNLVVRCAQIGMMALKLLRIKAVAWHSNCSKIEIERSEQQPKEWIQRAARDVRISLLQLIPFIGAKLASLYRMSGNWSDFLDTPALGGILEMIGISPSRIFFLSSGPAPHHHEGRGSQEYLALPNPTVQQTHDYLAAEIEKSLPGSLSMRELTVRIPVATEGGGTRYHDATMLFGSEDPAAKTVVLYHGMRSFREKYFDRAKSYISKGYNVLVMSYSGDPVVVGTGTGHHFEKTTCSELAMREDARADAEFLHHLGVREVAVEGYSLGGAQAMNFAQAIALNHQDMTMNFVVLDRTFTNVPDVCQNIVKNQTGSAFLGRLFRDFTRRSQFSSPKHRKLGCDGFDNVEKLRQVVKAKNFSTTKYFVVGARDDKLMGDYRPDMDGRNFARELHRNVKEALKEMGYTGKDLKARAMKEITEGFHLGSTPENSLEKRNRFLFE